MELDDQNVVRRAKIGINAPSHDLELARKDVLQGPPMLGSVSDAIQADLLDRILPNGRG